MTGLSSLCYIGKDGKYLMLHRTVKKNDVNKDKWIGVGGHFEADESPEECLLREVKEETGYTMCIRDSGNCIWYCFGAGYHRSFACTPFDTNCCIPGGSVVWKDFQKSKCIETDSGMYF